MKNNKVLLSIIVTLLFASFASAQTVIIVNSNHPSDNAAKYEVANIFLGKTTQWSDGLKADPIDQKKTTAAGQAFLAKIVAMDESSFKNLWVEKMLSGEADPPKVVESDAAVIEYVKSNTGAVGYISASTPHDGVKILSIDGNKEW